MTFRKVRSDASCSICRKDADSQEICKKNRERLEELNIPSISGNPFIKFPDVNGKDPPLFRKKHKDIWLRQRSEKTGSDDDTYHAATWHIPLKALLRYAESRQKSD